VVGDSPQKTERIASKDRFFVHSANSSLALAEGGMAIAEQQDFVRAAGLAGAQCRRGPGVVDGAWVATEIVLSRKDAATPTRRSRKLVACGLACEEAERVRSTKTRCDSHPPGRGWGDAPAWPPFTGLPIKRRPACC